MTLIVEEGQTGTNSAVYLTLRNDGGEPDRLTGGETTAATSAQIHESRMVDDVMRMQRVDGLDIRPGEPVVLKPGGIHIMLLGLTKPLIEGEEIDLTLHFLRSDDLVVSVPVRLLGGV